MIAEPTQGEVSGVSAAFIDASAIQGLLAPDPGLGENGRIYLIYPGQGTITLEGVTRSSPLDDLDTLDGLGRDSLATFVDAGGAEMAGGANPRGRLAVHPGCRHTHGRRLPPTSGV